MAIADNECRFLAEQRFAVLATINADGAPQQTVMWYLLDGDEVVINTAAGRVKDANLRRDPRVSVCIEDGYTYVTLSGQARLVEDQPTAQADIRRLASRYHDVRRNSSARRSIQTRLRPPDVSEEELMANTYQLTTGIKLVNTVVRALLRIGLPLSSTYLLTVKGRKSGRLFTTPVTVVEDHDQRRLVSPYGEVNSVRNAQAAGQVTLTKGHHSETVPIVELSSADRAPVLRENLRHVWVVRPFFDVMPSSPLEAFVAEASHHPVFLLSDHPAEDQQSSDRHRLTCPLTTRTRGS